MALSGLITSLSAVNSSTQIISGAMEGIQSGISKIGEFLGKIWSKFSGAAKDALDKIKSLWEEHIAPILDPWIDRAKTVLGILKDLFMGLVEKISGAIGSIPEKLENLKDGIIEKLSGVKDFILGIPSAIREAIGNALKNLKAKMGGIKDKLLSLKDTMKEVMTGVIEKIKAPFEYVWGIIEKIKNAITNVIGKAIDKIFGGGGGTNTQSTTTVGTAVQGGVTQNMTMNIDVSGMTDRTDKREVAREMGRLIQEEMARGMGGTTTQGRYA